MQALQRELSHRGIPFDALDRQVMCFGHIIDLSSGQVGKHFDTSSNNSDDEDGLSSLSNPIEHARSVVRVIRASGMRRDAFECVINDGNEKGWFTQGHSPEIVKLPKLDLLRDVQTRWDSTYIMLERLRVMRPVSLHAASCFAELMHTK